MKTTCTGRLAAASIGLVVGAGACASQERAMENSRGEAGRPTAVGNSTKLPNCPVMENEPIDLAIYTKTDDGRVYFCCRDCIKKYKANPAKYAEKVVAQRRALAEHH